MYVPRSNLAAVGAVASESNRYAINGLYIDHTGKTVATDGKILVEVEGTVEKNGDGEFTVILPAETVNEALKKMGRRKSAPREAEIAIKDDAVGFTMLEYPAHIDPETAREEDRVPDATHMVAGRLIPGNFPRYEDVIPNYNGDGVKVRLGIDVMLKLLKTLADIKRGDSDTNSFEMTVVDAEKPVLIMAEKAGTGQKITAVIMPVTTKD